MAASSETLAEIHALIAEARERKSPSPQQAREIALRALRQAQLRADPASICDARLVVGECCGVLGQHAEALEHLEGAIAAAIAAGDPSREAEGHRLIAATHDFVGNFDLAVQSHLEALRLHEGLGDDAGRAKLMRTIGVCLSKAGGFEEAIGWYRRSHETALRAGDEESALRSMSNIAIDLKNLGRLDESLALYEEALAAARTGGLDNFTAGVQANMGNTLALLGRLEEADRCLTEALEVHRVSGAPHALQNDLAGLGRVRLAQRRFGEAQALLEQALAVAEENRFRPDLGAVHEALAELHKARGDTARALTHYEAFNALSREILLDESKRRLKGVELRMRIEQSQREASRDRQKSLEIEKAYERLRATAAEKEALVAKLERQSLEDALTGLPNRVDFERRLAAACREPREAAGPTCLVLVAVEGLERAGIGAAKAWKEVGRVLHAHLHPDHALAHLGGGDFGVLMPGTDVAAAQHAARRLCAAVHAHDWVAVDPWIKPHAIAGIAEVDAQGDAAGLVTEARASVRDPRAPGRVRLTSVPAEERRADDAASGDDPAALIQAEQVRGSYANLPLIIGASFIAATLLCLVVRDVVALRTWGTWLAAMGTASATFLLLCRAFQRREPIGRATRRWGYYATAGCLALGCLWGVGDVVLHTPDSIDYQILVAVTAAIVASSAAFASATYLPPFYAFFLPAALPSAVILVNKDDATRVVTGLLLIFYLPIVTRFAIAVNRAFIESLRLRFQNIALVGELRAERDAAESANVAKSRFLAAASHDLRQPMHALGLFLQSLRQGRLAERERGLVENISASYNAMEGLFDALLDISRLDAGVVEPRVRTFAVKRVLERLRNEYASQAAAKGLALSVRACGAFVRSDPTLLEEIVGNFVSNAVRYTRDGRVVVGCRRSGGRLRIEVWDTGAGIPQDRQEDVFRDFVQLGNPERDRRQGLGLGLSIVQRLSRLLDHPVELRSMPGRGSVFRVMVPLGNAQEAEAPAEEAPILEPFEGRLIVVVDDDAAVVAAMETLLAQWGCEVASADSGARILGKLATATRRPDLILCDYRLRGGENGAQVISDIRAEFNEDIAAALITGDTDPERLKEARESGLPLLHKPVKAPRLRALMVQLLGRSSNEGSA